MFDIRASVNNDTTMLKSNLARLRSVAAVSSRVLDVGGWYQPFNLATHVIDLSPYSTRRTQAALDPEDKERFTAETWAVKDVCLAPWPYPDRFFDFVICSHLLEDVRDPLMVVRELHRVAKAGYVETPSRLREIYSKKRWFALRRALGQIPEVGFYHHRWFVEAEGTHLRFTAKTPALLENSSRYLTRGQWRRGKLTEAESSLCVWWEGNLTAEEIFIDPRKAYDTYGQEIHRRRRMGV